MPNSAMPLPRSADRRAPVACSAGNPERGEISSFVLVCLQRTPLTSSLWHPLPYARAKRCCALEDHAWNMEQGRRPAPSCANLPMSCLRGDATAAPLSPATRRQRHAITVARTTARVAAMPRPAVRAPRTPCIITQRPAPMRHAGYRLDGRRMEAVAKLGRSRFSSTIQAEKSLQETHCVGGTFFEAPIFGSSATASMRRPYPVLLRRAPTCRHCAFAVTPPRRHGTRRTRMTRGTGPMHRSRTAITQPAAPMARAGARVYGRDGTPRGHASCGWRGTTHATHHHDATAHTNAACRHYARPAPMGGRGDACVAHVPYDVVPSPWRHRASAVTPPRRHGTPHPHDARHGTNAS